MALYESDRFVVDLRFDLRFNPDPHPMYLLSVL